MRPLRALRKATTERSRGRDEGRYSQGKIRDAVFLPFFSTYNVRSFSPLLTRLYLLSLFQLHTPFNFVLMNLVLVELFCAAFALPLNVAAAASLGWPFGDRLCAATAVSQATSGEC